MPPIKSMMSNSFVPRRCSARTSVGCVSFSDSEIDGQGLRVLYLLVRKRWVIASAVGLVLAVGLVVGIVVAIVSRSAAPPLRLSFGPPVFTLRGDGIDTRFNLTNNSPYGLTIAANG